MSDNKQSKNITQLSERDVFHTSPSVTIPHDSFINQPIIVDSDLTENYFQLLYDVDVSEKVREKNGLKYVSWATAWAEVKKHYPNSTYHIFEDENGRFWFDDGRSGWVKVSVTVNGIAHTEHLSIMDNRNRAVPADEILSTHAVKAMQRALTKACGRHGFALYIYEGEDFPEAVKKTKDALKLRIGDVIALSKTLIDNGVKKDKVYKIIASHNHDNQNPRSITEIEICEKIIEDLNKLGGK